MDLYMYVTQNMLLLVCYIELYPSPHNWKKRQTNIRSKSFIFLSRQLLLDWKIFRHILSRGIKIRIYSLHTQLLATQLPLSIVY